MKVSLILLLAVAALSLEHKSSQLLNVVIGNKAANVELNEMLSGDFLSEFTQIESIEFKIKSGKFAGTHQLNKIIAKKNPDLPDATVSTKMKSDNKQSVIIDGLNTGVGAELILDDGSYFKAFLYLENYSVNFDTKVGEDDHAPYLSLRDKPTVTISDFKLSVPSLDDDISRAMIEKEKENIKEGL